MVAMATMTHPNRHIDRRDGAAQCSPMQWFRITNWRTGLRALIGWPMLVIGLYMAAAMIGSMIPRHSGWRETPGGSVIWLHNNGIHTSIIVPCRPPSGDAINSDLVRCLFPEGNAQAPSGNVRYQMIGWGDRDFYLNTPYWRDLRLGTAVTALLGSGQMLMHVDNLAAVPTRGVKPLRVNQREFTAIMDQLAASYRSAPLTVGDPAASAPIPGYGPDDVFYPAATAAGEGPRYSALYTCNNWVSDILANAGVRTARWSPFPGGVMRWFPAAAD
jgi:uncharacterized protein (TIGR02117 family)